MHITTLSTWKKGQTLEVPGLDRTTIRLIDGTQLFMMLYTVVVAVLNAGAISATVLTCIIFPTYLLYTLYTRNPLMTRLMIFGLVVGWLELIADYYAVEVVNSLKYYPAEEPGMVWTSPLYMPFAWTEVVVQVSLLGIRLMVRYGWAIASGVLAVAGGLYVFFYENLAKAAGWWHYENVNMIWNTPLFVSGAEVLLFLILPLVMLQVVRQSLWRAAAFGLACGLWIYLTAILCYQIFG